MVWPDLPSIFFLGCSLSCKIVTSVFLVDLCHLSSHRHSVERWRVILRVVFAGELVGNRNCEYLSTISSLNWSINWDKESLFIHVSRPAEFFLLLGLSSNLSLSLHSLCLPTLSQVRDTMIFVWVISWTDLQVVSLVGLAGWQLSSNMSLPSKWTWVIYWVTLWSITFLVTSTYLYRNEGGRRSVVAGGGGRVLINFKPAEAGRQGREASHSHEKKKKPHGCPVHAVL